MWSARFRVWVCAVLVCGIPAVCGAQPRSEVYVGSVIGVATLSADARSVISDSEVAVSLYEPHNGVAANVLLGAHVHDYVTIQGNYIWNRNDLMLLSTQTIGDGRSFSQEFRTSSQHMVVGDLLVYFRPRGDRVRPYLSGGFGAVRFRSERDADRLPMGDAPLRGLARTKVRATLRVAVGLDVRVGDGWSVRYSFSESLSGNPISEQLTPPGRRNLANFQNLVGVLRSF